MGGVGDVDQKNEVRQKNGMGLNVLLFNHTLIENTVSSVEYDLSVPTEFNKLYSSSLSYLIYSVLLLFK